MNEKLIEAIQFETGLPDDAFESTGNEIIVHDPENPFDDIGHYYETVCDVVMRESDRYVAMRDGKAVIHDG